MKRTAYIMAILMFFSKFLVAKAFDIDSLLGESWYGLYFNGQKAGYALHSVVKDKDGNVVLREDSKFKMNMSKVKQDMQVFSERTYRPDGSLVSIFSRVTDVGTSEFDARVNGDRLILKTLTGGVAKTQDLPKPKESLADAVKYAKWMEGSPQIGDTLTFSAFEPLYGKEIGGSSQIAGVEWRVLDGVRTKVYKIKQTVDAMPLDTISYVTEHGDTLEDQVADMLTMRLEPEEVAKDVDYSNDVIVSNAAMVDKPIADARTRKSLRLTIHGPLSEEHFFNDERQYIQAEGSAFTFLGMRMTLDGFKTATIPVTEPSVQEFIQPTPFIQSGEKRLINKAKEILGGEKDAWKAVNTLCHWVHGNMHTTFSARLTNAMEVLESLQGDCTEHSILFIGLARAAGIPAREVAGLIYVGDEPGFYFHQWASVWVGKWIDIDPTFDQPLVDVTHIKLAEGDLFKQAKLIPLIGKLKIEVAPETGDQKNESIRPPADTTKKP